MSQNNFIGIFDSGVGGTCIWQEVHQLLPYEHTLYLADSKNAPYGNKSVDEIIALSCKNTEYLLEQNCKLIIVACNTATTNAISVLRERYSVPFVGIEPAIKPAALHTQSNSIGILATKGTLGSELFHNASEDFASSIKLTEVVGDGLVRLIEDGQINSSKMDQLLQKYMAPMIKENIDYLVLGCTHYPFLIPKLRKFLSSEIKIIDSGEAVAKQTEKVLSQHHLLRKDSTPPNHIFYNNLQTDTLSSLLASFSKIISIQQKDF